MYALYKAEEGKSRPISQKPASSSASEQVGDHGCEQYSKIAISYFHRRVFQIDRQSQEQDGVVQKEGVSQRKRLNQQVSHLNHLHVRSLASKHRTRVQYTDLFQIRRSKTGNSRLAKNLHLPGGPVPGVLVGGPLYFEGAS